MSGTGSKLIDLSFSQHYFSLVRLLRQRRAKKRIDFLAPIPQQSLTSKFNPAIWPTIKEPSLKDLQQKIKCPTLPPCYEMITCVRPSI